MAKIFSARDKSTGNVYQWEADEFIDALRTYPGPSTPVDMRIEATLETIKARSHSLDSINFTISLDPPKLSPAEIADTREAFEEVSEMCGPPAPEPETTDCTTASILLDQGVALDVTAHSLNLTRLTGETDAQLRARIRIMMDFKACMVRDY